MKTLDTNKYRYEFVGGEFNGKMWQFAALEIRNLIKGYSKDLSEQRAKDIEHAESYIAMIEPINVPVYFL